MMAGAWLKGGALGALAALLWPRRSSASAAPTLAPTATDEYGARAAREALPAAGLLDWRGQVVDPQLREGVERFALGVRARGGRAVISTDPGAIGRPGPGGSQHQASPPRAVDLWIFGIDLQSAYQLARGLGVFSGIGTYPEWSTAPGLHLDTRPDRTPSDPAQWSGYYVVVNGQRIQRTDRPVWGAWA